jgi:hypothetical protein
MSETFQASTQYGDWSGEVKADDADFEYNFRHWLRKEGHIQPGEFLVGLKFSNSENLVRNEEVELAPVYVTAYVVPAASFDAAQQYLESADPLEVRTVRLKISLDDFFRHFKRFSIALAWRSLDLIGREFEANE